MRPHRLRIDSSARSADIPAMMEIELTHDGAVFTDPVLEVFRVNRLLLGAGDVLAGPSGLSRARWQLLGVVEHGDASPAQVALAMGLTPEGVQRTADEMAAEGMLAYVVPDRSRVVRTMSARVTIPA